MFRESYPGRLPRATVIGGALFALVFSAGAESNCDGPPPSSKSPQPTAAAPANKPPMSWPKGLECTYTTRDEGVSTMVTIPLLKRPPDAGIFVDRRNSDVDAISGNDLSTSLVNAEVSDIAEVWLTRNGQNVVKCEPAS